MERINKASGKYCYAYWLTRWWPRDEVLDRLFDGTLSIATFLCLWLSRDVFEDSGTLLKPFVVPFAIKISQEPSADARHVFSEKDNARIMRWSTKQPRFKKRLIDVLDDESEFNFRPWVSIPSCISQPTTFNTGGSRVVSSGAGLSNDERSFMPSCTPGHLISATYGEISVEEYKIYREDRQMGMDQCVPTFRRRKPLVEQLRTHLDRTHVEGSAYWFPFSDRITYVTPGYVDFWDQQLERLHNFTTTGQPPVKNAPSAEMLSTRPRLKYLSGDKRKTSPGYSQDGRNVRPRIRVEFSETEAIIHGGDGRSKNYKLLPNTIKSPIASLTISDSSVEREAEEDVAVEVESTGDVCLEDRNKENPHNSKPNESNGVVDVDTSNSGSLNTPEPTQVLNTKVEDTETNKDNSSSPVIIDEETTVPALQGHERVFTEVMETSIVSTPVIEKHEPQTEETEETVAMTVEVAPIIENRVVVHEYPSAGVSFDPSFDASLPYHELVGGFSVPIGYAGLYEKIWKKFGHIIVNRDPERAYDLTMQVTSSCKLLVIYVPGPEIL
ncbi:uncharacterized protein LOC113334842 isoform X2 [Papaver somniferum]|uniref:uncharacterized protein LOC113334842 isoform X2 n=1 Tax=Papaver somniferum TaxID=3469 RepID=UPI000E6FADF3|nr:uncharacterized protein LOC113334842 isoform X2 [Papaver somniferum]